MIWSRMLRPSMSPPSIAWRDARRGRVGGHTVASAGTRSDRSLPNVAKNVREFAPRLAHAMRHPRSLRTVVRLLMEEVSKVKGQTPRKKEPNAYQLLLNPNLLAWTLS